VVVATPKTIVWERDPHTAAKHDLLRRYLEAWTPILLSRFPRVTYAEGFAGPGVYTGGEPGSPVIALDVFLGRRGLLDGGKALAMVLVEADSRRLERLRDELRNALARHGRPKPANLRIVHQQGECSDLLQGELDKAGAFGQPIFAVLDSYGGPDIPFDLLKSIASNRSSEVLVTFGPTFFTRFAEVVQHRQSGDWSFGGSHWQDVSRQPPEDKKKFLVDAYRQTLRLAGFAHSLTFEMVDEGGRALFLIFGTNEPLGLAKMKDALWKVDPLGGVRYRDPHDPGQALLELVAEPDKAALARMMLARISDRALDIKSLREFALLETIYRPEHVIATVRGLVKNGALECVQKGGGITQATVVRRAVDPARSPTQPVVQAPLFDL
jgi:three-Cys-motif partner protein